jgi:AhpD family alkylhydroperoxidase
MSKDWIQVSKDVDARSAELFKGAPGVMQAFRGLVREADKDGALDKKTKELAALAIAIAIRCEGCLSFHVRAVIKYGATRDEVLEIIGVAVEMGGGPAAVYGAEALEAFDQLSS